MSEPQGEDLGDFSRKALAAAEKARLEGRQEGRREQLLRLLELRFGTLSEAQRRCVQAAGSEERERLFTLAATATSLSEVFH